MAQTDDADLIGPLLESAPPALVAGSHIFYADVNLYFEVIAALTRLLPKITEIEYRLLNRREKKILHQMLASQYPEVALPTIAVVTRMGDASAMPILQKVVRKKAKAEDAAAIFEAAKGCLATLQNSAV